jgi:hypothetical protein
MSDIHGEYDGVSSHLYGFYVKSMSVFDRLRAMSGWLQMPCTSSASYSWRTTPF